MRRGLLLAGLAALLSGVSVFVNSYGVKAFGDATIYTTAKNTIAGMLLVGVVVAGRRGRLRTIAPIGRGQVAGLAAIAVVGGSVPFVLFFEGLSRVHSGAAQAQFINKTLVVWVALLAVVALRERVGVVQAAAVGVLVVGQAVLSGGRSGLAQTSWGSGQWLILGATLLWAVEVVLSKALLRQMTSWTVAVARMAAGSLLLITWVTLTGRLPELTRLDANQWKWVLITGALLAAYVGTWLAALALAPAVSVTAVLVAAVPVTAVLQAIAAHGSLAAQLDGLALVTAGAALATAAALRGRGRRTHVPA